MEKRHVYLYRIPLTQNALSGQKTHPIDTFLGLIAQLYPEVTLSVVSYPVTCAVTLKGAQEKRVESAYQEVLATLQEYVFSTESPLIERAIQKILVLRKEKLVLAESCTGGALAARITKQQGASQYFLGSLVVYSLELKEHFLSLSPSLLAEEDGVGPKTVEALLEGLFHHTTATYGMVVTGIAGPGSSRDKPVGTLWMALGKRGLPCDSGQVRAQGDREEIIAFAVELLLVALWRKLAQDKKTFCHIEFSQGSLS